MGYPSFQGGKYLVHSFLMIFLPSQTQESTTVTFLDLIKMLGKSKKYIPNGGLMVIYYGTR